MIDWARVAELRSEIGADDFGEVVDLFLEEVEAEVAGLTGPVQGLEARLHFLKGSALNLGFDRFSRLCQDGEVRAAGGDGQSVDLAAIRDAYTQSRTQFLAELDTRFD
ncbi:MAG: Hpt domain-containing protein [Pseudomonadota bacterium]